MTKEAFYETVRCALLFIILCLLGFCYHYNRINKELKETNELQKQVIDAQQSTLDMQSSVTDTCHKTLMGISTRLGLDPNTESLPVNEALAAANVFRGMGGGDFPEKRKYIKRGKNTKRN